MNPIFRKGYALPRFTVVLPHMGFSIEILFTTEFTTDKDQHGNPVDKYLWGQTPVPI